MNMFHQIPPISFAQTREREQNVQTNPTTRNIKASLAFYEAMKARQIDTLANRIGQISRINQSSFLREEEKRSLRRQISLSGNIG